MPPEKNIFVVDDDDFFRQMLVDDLSKMPFYKVKPFATGEDCLKNMYAPSPDIIILDYTLNDVNTEAKNGLEILNEIKKILPAVHVIMLSSQNKYGVAVKTIAKGAEHYVIKDNNSFKNIKAILESYT